MAQRASGIGLDDFYGLRSTQFQWRCAISRLRTRALADPTPDDGWTTGFDNIKCYDSLHVRALINQIDGYNHDRTAKVGVRSVRHEFSSGKRRRKLAVDPVTAIHGGYTDVLGTPSEGLIGELDFVDHRSVRLLPIALAETS